jgi:predicted acyltransferase
MARTPSKRSVGRKTEPSVPGPSKSAPAAGSPGRIVSLDALRGFDMLWIMGGDAFFPALFTLVGSSFLLSLSRQLEHSAWNGFTFYDLIFPLFLFIVGCSMPFALGRRLEKGESRNSITGHVFKRTLTLLILGLLYNGLLHFRFTEMRWVGVLQRIALCYFFASILFIRLKPRALALVSALILLGYWAVMQLVPVPGFGRGVTPEGIAGWWTASFFRADSLLHVR